MSQVKEDERYLTKLRAQLSSHFSSISDKAFHSEVFHAVVFCVACAVGGYVGARLSVTATSIVTSILAVGSTVYRAQGRSFASLIPVQLGPNDVPTTPPTASQGPSTLQSIASYCPSFLQPSPSSAVSSVPHTPPVQRVQQIEQNTFLNLTTAEKREIGNLLLRRIGIPCIESVLNFISIPENRVWVLQIFKRKNLVTTTTQTESSVTMAQSVTTATTQTTDPEGPSEEPLVEGLVREQTLYFDSSRDREETVEGEVSSLGLDREQTLYYDPLEGRWVDREETLYCDQSEHGLSERELTVYFDSMRDREQTMYFESSEVSCKKEIPMKNTN